LVAALFTFAATSPPSAYDQEKGEVTLSASTPRLTRDIELDVHLEGAFGGEEVVFTCGMAWEEDAPPTAVRMTVVDLDAPADAEPKSTKVLSNIGTKYEDGSRSPGPHALVSVPVPCEGDADCSGRYRFTCELPDPPTDREVAIEWSVSAHVQYDPGGFCGGDRESTLDLRTVSP
jgi:hypothetical protein